MPKQASVPAPQTSHVTPYLDAAHDGTVDPPVQFTTKLTAELAGVTVRAMRYYHQIGLLAQPERTSSGLMYSAEHLLRLLRIQRLTAIGLSLDEVAVVLDDPTSSGARHILVELDGELARRIEQIQNQRGALENLCCDDPPTGDG